jgi:hypothetical protein
MEVLTTVLQVLLSLVLVVLVMRTPELGTYLAALG